MDGLNAHAQFRAPSGLAVPSEGTAAATRLFVADTGNDALRILDLVHGTVPAEGRLDPLRAREGAGLCFRFGFALKVR